jgi:hypothetical protein
LAAHVTNNKIDISLKQSLIKKLEVVSEEVEADFADEVFRYEP